MGHYSPPIGKYGDAYWFWISFTLSQKYFENIYTKVEVETLKSAVPMGGAINIVEGAIPLVMNDIVRRCGCYGYWRICWWCNDNDPRPMQQYPLAAY